MIAICHDDSVCLFSARFIVCSIRRSATAGNDISWEDIEHRNRKGRNGLRLDADITLPCAICPDTPSSVFRSEAGKSYMGQSADVLGAALGHQLPPRALSRAAARLPITDTEARGRRGRDGPCMDGARVARANLTFLRSVRVQPCIRPVFAWRITSVAMQPQWLLALM